MKLSIICLLVLKEYITTAQANESEDEETYIFGTDEVYEFVVEPNDQLPLKLNFTPMAFENPVYNNEGKMLKPAAEVENQAKKMEFVYLLVDYQKEFSLSFVRVDSLTNINYHTCAQENKNASFSRCTNASSSIDLNLDFSGRDHSNCSVQEGTLCDFSLLTIFSIFSWATGLNYYHEDVSRIEARYKYSKTNDVLKQSNEYEYQEWRCKTGKCNDTLWPNCRTATVPSSPTDAGTEVQRGCCKCYPGRKKISCDADGNQNMVLARQEFWNSADGDCDQKDPASGLDSSKSDAGRRYHGHCPYFCECGSASKLEEGCRLQFDGEAAATAKPLANIGGLAVKSQCDASCLVLVMVHAISVFALLCLNSK